MLKKINKSGRLFVSKKTFYSADYINLVTTLIRYESEHSDDYVSRAYAEVICDEFERTFKRKYKVDKESKAEPSILKLMSDKKKRRAYAGSYNYGLAKGLPGGIDDHPSMWLYNGKPVVYLTQPYSHRVNTDTLNELLEFCNDNDLWMTVDLDVGFHFPGRVVPIVIMAKDRYNKLR